MAGAAETALTNFLALDDGGGDRLVTAIDGINATADQVIKNISKVKHALDRMYIRGRGAMSYEEVLAKYNAAGNTTDTMTLPELVRLFSPSDPVFNSIDDARGITAFKAALDVDPRAVNAALDRARNIVRSTNDHLQTAMPEIIFSECNVNGAGTVTPGYTLTYGPATVTTAPAGDVTFKVYGLDARNLGLNDGDEKKVKKTPGINPTGQFEQTPLNCLRLEHLTLLEGSKLARPEQTSKAFVIAGANSFRNTCVCFAFSHPDGSTKFECPVDTKFVTLPTGCKIFIRYPDRAVIYTSNSNTRGSVEPPLGFKFKIRISNPAIFKHRNAFNTYMGQQFRILTGCNVLNNPTMNPPIAANNDCVGINVAGKTYGFRHSASINGNNPLAIINHGPTVPITIDVVTGVSPDDTATKFALRTLARIYSWEYMNLQSQAGTDLFQQHFGGKKNITNKKYRNVNKRQRRSKSKSKSMSMLKSAKRTFYRTNKRNKTSKKY